MKIFAAPQIKACDAYTIKQEDISSADLMERAAIACTEWIMASYSKDTLFIALCGTGNNGGDGLAIARLLQRQSYGVKAFLLQFSKEMSGDCSLNLARLQETGVDTVEILQPGVFITDIPPHIVILDAILGIGLNREADGWLSAFITHINQLPNKKIAIDIPSGMPADSMPGHNAAIINADDTLSFQFYKQAFIHPETGSLAGNVHILDIGLNKHFIDTTHTSYYIIDNELVKEIYQPRQPFSHKGTYGTALLIGGSYGMMGAILLAARAASRAGAGKVKALIPVCGYDILQSAVPEAMCDTNGHKYIDTIEGWADMQGIGIGPGLGTQPETAGAFATFIEECKQPLVIDADALNILAEHTALLHKLPAHSILTPHPKEFDKVFGNTGNSLHRVEHARAQAMKYNVYIVLKGRYTAVVTPEGDCLYNINGNAGLATGGSGDVLTGIITGLLAQGYTSFAASLLGVYLHGLAGEMASEAHSQEAMIAGDIAAQLGSAFKTLL